MFLDDLINGLKEFRQALDINDILFKVWQDPVIQDYIIELNTNQQLRLGQKSNNQSMPDYASLDYLGAKRSAGLRKIAGEETDLFVSGNFYATWNVIPLRDGFEIEADTDIYGKDFIRIYGLDILGLNDKNMAKLVDRLKDEIITILKERTQKAFNSI